MPNVIRFLPTQLSSNTVLKVMGQMGGLVREVHHHFHLVGEEGQTLVTAIVGVVSDW